MKSSTGVAPIASPIRSRAAGLDEAEEMTVSQHCLTCHARDLPETATHLAHRGKDSAGCEECHTPELAADGEGYSIHDHRFYFTGEGAKPPESVEQR